MLFDDEIRGSLLYQAEELVETLFLKYLIAPVSYRGMTRVETYPYSKDAVREIVRNALMHQDFINGMPVQLSVHPDRLYLTNAGGLPSGWSVRRLFQKHGSETRNGLVANTFYRGGFVETWGRGIDKVCRECRRLGVARPKYETTTSDVMVSLEALITRPDIQLQGTKSAPSQAPSRRPMSLYDRILSACAESQSARNLMALSGRTDLTKFRRSVLAQMLAEGTLELTIPDVPNSRLQKYRTTGKGKSALLGRIETSRSKSSADRTDDGTGETINETISETISETIKSHSGISRAALIEMSGKSRATIARAVSELLRDGRIERRGSKKAGGYYVIERGS